MSISQILAILKARWIVLVSVFLGVFLLAIAITMLLPKKYSASAALLLDVKSPDPVMGIVLPAMMTPSYMATQVDLLESERVAIQVIRKLRLSDNAQLLEQWRSTSEGMGSFESWIAQTLGKSLTVKPSRESNVITVTYEAVDPQFSAVMANAFAEAYIDTTAELKTDPARKYNAIFDTLTSQVRERLEKAQARLSSYQREHGLLATDERLDIESTRLLELSQQFTMLGALQSESANREIQSKRDAERTQEVLNNPVVAALKADLARLEYKAEEYGARMGDAHPQVVELKASIASLRRQLSMETQRVTSSMGINNTVNEARVAKARSELEAQRNKVLEMKAQRDAASVLLRDVDNLQKAYDAVQLRATQAGMDSQTTQTNVSVVQVASPSATPSSPKTLINLILGFLGGIVLSLTSVLLLELSDRRVRTTDDVLNDLRLPLVGVMLRSADAPSGLLGGKARPWLMRRSPEALAGQGA